MDTIACSFFFYLSVLHFWKVEEEREELVNSDHCIELFSVAMDVPCLGGTFSFFCDFFKGTSHREGDPLTFFLL